MKKLLTVILIGVIIFCSCSTKEAETYTGILEEKNQSVSIKQFNGKIAVSIQELSKLCGWDCIPC